MTLSLYDITIPALVRGLENLSAQIDKAVAHAQEKGIDEKELTGARLAEDMFDFVRQVQRACDTAKFAAARISRKDGPVFADAETTFAELKTRIADTIAYLRSVAREDIDAGEQASVRFKAGPRELAFTGAGYATCFALPNFYFHATAAYAILRHKGVPLGKPDYLGKIQ